jgi:hypothetical protein
MEFLPDPLDLPVPRDLLDLPDPLDLLDHHSGALASASLISLLLLPRLRQARVTSTQFLQGGI